MTAERTRNGVETLTERIPSTGWVRGATTKALADNNTIIQAWGNTFDEAGNLRSRSRSQPTNMGYSLETFTYGKLDRLKTARVQMTLRTANTSRKLTYWRDGEYVFFKGPGKARLEYLMELDRRTQALIEGTAEACRPSRGDSGNDMRR